MKKAFLPSAARALPRALPRVLHRLRRNDSGISMVEFGLILPFLVLLGIGGLEIANMVTINMQVSQLALSVADNASRLGQADNSSTTPKVNEVDIAALMGGAAKQGASINFAQNGRVILSSLEVKSINNAANTADDTYYIHWQRCSGSLSRTSAYGAQGATVTHMGRATAKLLPVPTVIKDENNTNTDVGVMYAEVYYRYRPLFANFLFGNMVFRQEAGFLVRDDRNYAANAGTSTTNCS